MITLNQINKISLNPTKKAIPASKHIKLLSTSKSTDIQKAQSNNNKLQNNDNTLTKDYLTWKNILLTSSTIITELCIYNEAALAKGGEYGILEGRTLALIHPALMFGLLGISVYAGYLGLQWRRLREVTNEIKELKSQLPAVVPEGGERPASPLDSEIAKLETTRKELINGGYRDKHWNMGSILLGGGISIAVFGCLNTYTRAGKLFPGPHLFSGAAIVVCWAIAASLVPSMQKGNNTSRTLHIGLNVLNVLLFVSQVPTGLEIVGKVFQFTTWP